MAKKSPFMCLALFVLLVVISSGQSFNIYFSQLIVDRFFCYLIIKLLFFLKQKIISNLNIAGGQGAEARGLIVVAPAACKTNA